MSESHLSSYDLFSIIKWTDNTDEINIYVNVKQGSGSVEFLLEAGAGKSRRAEAGQEPEPAK